MKNGCIVLVLIFIPFFYQACTGCSDDDYPEVKQESAGQPTKKYSGDEPKVDHTSGGRVIVKMIKQNGVYKIKARINGQELEFIFDTGAGMISLSNLEATLLYKEGKITKEDIVGKENFQDATGNISEGVIINLKEVTIGDRTVYNIQASVTNNSNAPVLFGQTALEKFGRVTIDYNNLEITFE